MCGGKKTEGVLTVRHYVSTQLQILSTAPKQMFKRTKKPNVTVHLGFKPLSDEARSYCLLEKFMNNFSADGTLAGTVLGLML